MATKISNVMLEIQAANYFFFLPTTLSLKNVASSLTNEEKEKQYMKKPNQKNQLTSIVFQS
jgi:hypothetical protein